MLLCLCGAGKKWSYIRAVVSKGAGGTLAPPEFGCHVNPTPTRGADYAHNITASTPGFENLKTSLYMDGSIAESC